MDRYGMVSIWVGNFTCLSELEEYVSIKYTEDGDSLDSQFERDFVIDYLDEDFREFNFLDESTNIFSELIDGHSYFNSIISSYVMESEDKLDKTYNTTILVYDLDYDGNTNKVKCNNIDLNFIGNFRYDKMDY